MNTTLIQRAQVAVLSKKKMAAAAAEIKHVLWDGGSDVNPIDLRKLIALSQVILEKRFTTGDRDASGADGDVIYEFGEDHDNPPNSLAVSWVANAAQRVLEQVLVTLRDLEQQSDKMANACAQRKAGSRQVEVDFNDLVVRESLPLPRHHMRNLALAAEVLQAGPETLERLKAVSGDSGSEAFGRDLAAAVTESPAWREFFNRLSDASSEEAVEEVLVLPEVQGSKHRAPVGYFGTLIKAVLGLPPEQRARVKEWLDRRAAARRQAAAA